MFKTCPQCGDEFVQHVSVCPDCRVPLQASDGAPASAAAPTERDLPGGLALENAIALRQGNTTELRQLAEALTAAGIACAIDTDPPGAKIRATPSTSPQGRLKLDVRLAIFVDARDREAASVVVARWLGEAIPGAQDAAPAGMIDTCPGCSEPLTVNATACASCGLEFPPLEVACPACGRPVAVEAERCPSCGHRP